MQAPKNIDNEEGIVRLKDFQPGNTAYRLCMHTGTNREPHIAEFSVMAWMYIGIESRRLFIRTASKSKGNTRNIVFTLQ